MSKFQDIKLSWGGKSLIIRSDQVMRAIAVIEEHVTINELSEFAKRKTAPMARISLAYAALIKFAGGECEAEDVYASMFSGDAKAAQAMDAVNGLLVLMLPPGNIAPEVEGQDPKKSLAAAASSKKRTKRQLAKAG